MAELIAGAGAGTALADGAAAGSGAGDEGTGTGGTGTGVADTGAGESGGDEGAGSGEGAEDGGEGAESGGAEDGAEGDELGEIEGLETDGRRIDDSTRKAIAALKKIDPQAAKRVADNYFRMSSVMKEIGATNPSEAVNKVRQMAATLDSLGGDEGITNLQTEVEDYRREINQFSNGDPELLKQLNEGNPEQFVNMIGQGLELIASKSPDALDKALLPVMVARLEKANMPATVDAIIEFIKEGKGQEAFDLMVSMKKWLGNAKTNADRQVQMKSEKNPEREALDRDRQQLENDKREQYEGRVATDVNRQNNSATAKIVEPFFKELKLRPEGRREFINALNSRIWATMKADGGFQRAAKAIMAKGEQEKASRFVHAKFAELLPDHFRKLRDAMYPNFSRGGTKQSAEAGKKAAAQNGDKKAAAGAPVVAGKVYPKSAVDIVSTPDVLLVVGKAYLKGTTTPVLYERS